MPRKAKELSALHVKRLTEPGFHSVGGVSGLALRVYPSGARCWVLRLLIADKRRDVGLGGFPDVTLEQARARARDVRAQREQGIDPIEERREARQKLRDEQAKGITFADAFKQFMRNKLSEFKNAKHAQQWTNTITTYAIPFIGNVPVRAIELTHVLQVLEPIWTEKTETATRVRQRIESVLDWAKVSGYRNGSENPARWKGNLDKILAKPTKLKKVQHHNAMPYSELPAFMKSLRKRKAPSARALEFAILTAARSGEVRFATWDEIDLSAELWTISAERMKAGREHRVPLSPAAVKLIKTLPKLKGTELLFASSNRKALSEAAMLAVCKRMKVDVVPHGFRSTFRDWAAETTHYPNEVCEMALAHVIDNKAEAAYRRGDLFEKRQALMRDWADFAAGKAAA